MTDCLRCKDLLHFTTSEDVVIHVDGLVCEMATGAIARGSLTTASAQGFRAAMLNLPPAQQNDEHAAHLYGNGYVDGGNLK